MGSMKKNKSVEPNDCRLWTEPRHFKYTLPRANMHIYLNRSTYPRDYCEESDWFRILASELSLISSKTFALPPEHLREEVDRDRLAYAIICDKSDCFGSMLLFFFVEPIHGWSTYGIQFFKFYFERILYGYEIKAYFLKNLFLSYFFDFNIIQQPLANVHITRIKFKIVLEFLLFSTLSNWPG